LADLNKALELNPSNTTALFNRAHLFEKRQEYAKAIADFLRPAPATSQYPGSQPKGSGSAESR
jgi:Tfp pilus assembly protein PilF